MKRISTSAVALVAAGIFLTTSAGATDLLDDKYDPAPSGVSVNWSGVYIGGRLGYGNANHDLSAHEYFKDYCGDDGEQDEFGFDDGRDFDIDNRAHFLNVDGVLKCEESGLNSIAVPGDSREIGNLDGLNSQGVVGGFQLGADQQLGKWVIGAFGSYDWADMDTTASLGGVNFTLIEKQDEWSLGLRVGRLLTDRTMLYVLGAYTQTDYDFMNFEDGVNTVTFDGFTFGGGLEHAIASNVFIGIEGTHTIYSEETVLDTYAPEVNSGFNIKDDLNETKVMGTLKIKLNGDIGGF